MGLEYTAIRANEQPEAVEVAVEADLANTVYQRYSEVTITF